MHAFIEGFAPHLNRYVVTEVMSLTSAEAQKGYFKDIEIPDYKSYHHTNVIAE